MSRGNVIVLAPLGKELADRKAQLEKVVDEGKVSFVVVGHALAELKANPEFYAPQSFESYAEQRFGFKKTYVWRLRAAAGVVDVLSDGNVDNWQPSLPSVEGTIRPLTRLLPRRSDEIEPEQRDRIEAAWARACKLAEDEGATVTGRHVKAAVDEVTGKKAKGPTLAPPRPLSIADLTDIFEADDAEFPSKYTAVKDDLFRFRAAINATIRKAEQLGITGHVIVAGGAK